MPPAESFDLQATAATVGSAMMTVVCGVGFQVGIHGLILGLIVGFWGLALFKQGRSVGRPMMMVCRKLAIFCGVLMFPGLVALLTAGHLPAVGELKINSVGLIGFWSLIIAHLCMEEANFQWFRPDKGN